MESDRQNIARASQLSAAHTDAKTAREASSKRYTTLVVAFGVGTLVLSFAATGISGGLLPSQISGDDPSPAIIIVHFVVNVLATVLICLLLACATLLVTAREAVDAHTMATTACQEALLAYQSWQLARANRAANVGPLLEAARETYRATVEAGKPTAITLPSAISAKLDAGGFVDAGNDLLRVFLLFRILEDERSARQERQEQRRLQSPPVPSPPTPPVAGSTAMASSTRGNASVLAKPLLSRGGSSGTVDGQDFVAIPASDSSD